MFTLNVLGKNDLSTDCNGRCKYGKHIGGGKYVCEHNNLKVKNPELANEWNKEFNYLTPINITYGSHVSIYWNCPNNPTYIYLASVNSRTNSKSGCPICPICSGNKITLEKSRHLRRLELRI